MQTPDVLVRFENLHTCFHTEAGTVQAINGVSFEVRRGQTLCVVGESGCGKSVTSLSLMGLLKKPSAEIVEGHIYYDGKDLVQASEKEMRAIRGNRISMIFQEPMTSLNPALKIGFQMTEVLRLHANMRGKEAEARAIHMLGEVRIPNPAGVMKRYPHELSGGMRQRVMIAMALACRPELLIADEPTTALDVTIQAQILDLMRIIKKETQTSIMLITHDLGVVAEMADYVVVMYAGRVVEQGRVLNIFDDPHHPYTKGLMQSRVRIGERSDRLFTIPGQVPSPLERHAGCAFAERCPYVMERCRAAKPGLTRLGKGHEVRCFLEEKESVAEQEAVHG